MPDGQYSIYLHSDDRTDIAAMATISTISQPLRGDFIRTAATAGAVVYQADARLPALIPVLFDGQLSAIRLCAVMALVSGTWSSLSGLPDEADGGMAALAMSPGTGYQRRRYTLTLQDDRSSERVESVLTGVSSRLRGDLLRNLIITGLALHTTAPELPRLLASMPVPPATVSELQILVQQMADSGIAAAGVAAVTTSQIAAPSATPSPGPETAGIKKNMRRAFGD
ncbi:plasmid partitioning/stability family protein [Enterobacter sp. MALB-1]|uniref:plasmid partitioning/stability family protein n=1 Tax=Enterobacter sp. MALB-1 TaxID=3153561 RepID=UPI0034DB5E36